MPTDFIDPSGLNLIYFTRTFCINTEYNGRVCVEVVIHTMDDGGGGGGGYDGGDRGGGGGGGGPVSQTQTRKPKKPECKQGRQGQDFEEIKDYIHFSGLDRFINLESIVHALDKNGAWMEGIKFFFNNAADAAEAAYFLGTNNYAFHNAHFGGAHDASVGGKVAYDFRGNISPLWPKALQFDIGTLSNGRVAGYADLDCHSLGQNPGQTIGHLLDSIFKR